MYELTEIQEKTQPIFLIILSVYKIIQCNLFDCLDESSTDCPRDCMGRGKCIAGQCHCDPGYQGWACSESKLLHFYLPILYTVIYNVYTARMFTNICINVLQNDFHI